MKKIRNLFSPVRIVGLMFILLTILLLLFLRFNVGTIMMVDGESMMPFYQDRDFVLVSVVKDTSELKVGDVVVIEHEGRRLVKRVQATPGGTTIFDAEKSVPAMTMQENQFYVTGDNYRNSYDSRYFGAITGDQILYKCTNVHWSQIGTIIAVFIPAVIAMYCMSFVYIPTDLTLDSIEITESIAVPQK